MKKKNKFKKLIIGVAMFAASTVLANDGNFFDGVVLSKRTVELNVDISITTVKLSQADYSSPVVKVLVPELADVTILDHRNTGEGAPCLATYDTFSPQKVIQNNPAIEKIKFDIVLKKSVVIDPKRTICTVWLSEEVEGRIRGFKFVHKRALFVGERHMDDCR